MRKYLTLKLKKPLSDLYHAQWAVRGGIGKNFKMGKKTTHLSFHIYEGQKLVEF